MEKINVTQHVDAYSIAKYPDLKEKAIEELFVLFAHEMYNSKCIEAFEEKGVNADTFVYGLLGYCLSHSEFIEIIRLLKSIKTILPMGKQQEINRLEKILSINKQLK